MTKFWTEILIIVSIAMLLAACTAYTVVNIITDNREAQINKEAKKTGVKVKVIAPAKKDPDKS